MGSGNRRPACSTRRARLALPGGRRRWSVLRPQDRHQGQGLTGPVVAMLNDPVRFQPTRTLRHDLHCRGREGAPPGHGASCFARKPGEVHRMLDRTLRRGIPCLAGADSGQHHSDCRPSHRLCTDGGRKNESGRNPRYRQRNIRADERQNPQRATTESSVHAGSRGSRARSRSSGRATANRKRPWSHADR